MITLHFSGADGVVRSLTGAPGATVMEVASANGVAGISADCGGCMSCGTCHVYVAPDFVACLPPAGEMELALLDNLIDPRPNSRLSCQLVLTNAFDGMRFDVPDAI
jgi:2Fe-2S ferredoxin